MGDYHKKTKYREKLSRVRIERKIKLGYINSPETRRRIGDARRGKKYVYKNKPGPKPGYTLSDEMKQRIRIKLLGPNSPAWRGGMSSINKAIRKLSQYRDWRFKVYTRDNFTCQGCEFRGGRLEPHHKKGLALIIEENDIKTTIDATLCREIWDVSNGETLCKICHSETDNFRKVI